jgi:FixJ family two-component response regulator
LADTDRVVFVVDDEVVIAQTLAIILNQAGFKATAFDHP